VNKFTSIINSLNNVLASILELIPPVSRLALTSQGTCTGINTKFFPAIPTHRRGRGQFFERLCKYFQGHENKKGERNKDLSIHFY
jgi:hypothetical protein